MVVVIDQVGDLPWKMVRWVMATTQNTDKSRTEKEAGRDTLQWRRHPLIEHHHSYIDPFLHPSTHSRLPPVVS